MPLDPRNAALYAAIAITLIVVGFIVTTPVLTTEQRGTGVAAAIGILLLIAWRARRHDD